ncbi:MAG: hypothetical protein A2X35_08810 [Elusimicrobia bacterium GWA2_61_42]|nr:MAG: hypothetical protein A2X35_08810 [Elusimicrobia bacterium GWA2_61_42]OGR75597.1 MAG: hypothetical protein A2X38_12900 [Elusimicrobia bacterium GWC2_61_25]
MLLRNSFAFSCLLLCAAPAGAVFEDVPAGARQLGFGGQAAALEDPVSFFANPALPGASRKFEMGADFLGSHRTTQGPANFSLYGAWALIPRMAYGRMGTLTLAGQYRDDNGLLTQKTIAFGWATTNLLRTDSGLFDFGVNFKILQAADAAGESVSGLGLDLGAVFRPDNRHTVGFSILNLNNPSFALGALEDSAPRVLRLGVAEKREDFTLSLDLAKRSGSAGEKGNVSLNPGIEHAWRTERAGRLFSRAGLFLASRASALSAGLGWKHAASELSYGIAVPLTGAISPAHSLTLALRFGDRAIEDEYERMIKQEIKYRKDLIEALDESARREGLLKEELSSMKAEIDALNARLKDTQEQKASVAGEKDRLAAVVRRQAAAESELKALAEKRKADKLNQLRYDFSTDWQAYLKLKGGGAPPDVLRGSLQRTVSQYQDSGIDISQATVELRSLLK